METAEQKTIAAVCSSCAAPLAAAKLFCDECGRLQPPPATADYFQVFGLPRRLALDAAALETQFYRLSRKLHPDVYARSSGQEQQWSLANASILNDAYRTLKDPLARTEYLLGLEGLARTETQRGQPGKDVSRAPADLLEEVFELNMELEEMRASRQSGEDGAGLRENLSSAKERFEAQLGQADAKLRQLWSQWDEAESAGDEPRKTQAREAMAALLDRRRYIGNLVREVNDALEN